MQFADLGQALQKKFPHYAGIDPVELGKKLVQKIPEYAQHLSAEANNEAFRANQMNKRYGATTALGYQMSGGTGNIGQMANDFVTQHHIPLTVLTSELAKQQREDPQYQTNLKMEHGQPLTQHEQQLTQQAGIMPLMGTTGEVNGASKPFQALEQDIPNLLKPPIRATQYSTDVLQDVKPEFMPFEASKAPLSVVRESKAASVLTRPMTPQHTADFNKVLDILGSSENKGTSLEKDALNRLQDLAQEYLPKRLHQLKNQSLINTLIKGTQ